MKIYFYTENNERSIFVGKVSDCSEVNFFIEASVKDLCNVFNWEDAIVIGGGYTVNDNYYVLIKPLYSPES